MLKLRISQHFLVGLFFLLFVSATFAYVDSGIPANDRLTFLNVGQGDATLFETSQGERVLIDGGPDDLAAKGLSRKIPWWDRRLNAIVITHSHLDHIQGLEQVLNNFQVEKLYMAKNIEINPVLSKLIAQAKGRGTAIWLLAADYQLNFSSNTRLKLLVDASAQGSNEQCLVAVLEEVDNKVIMLADVGGAEEKKLITKLTNFKSQIIRIGHHGSDLGTSQEMLDRWQPRQAVISVGQKNSFGHPSQRVLKRLERNKVAVSRTDNQGDVIFDFVSGEWLAP